MRVRSGLQRCRAPRAPSLHNSLLRLFCIVPRARKQRCFLPFAAVLALRLLQKRLVLPWPEVRHGILHPQPAFVLRNRVAQPASVEEKRPIPDFSHRSPAVWKKRLTRPIIFPVIQTVRVLTASSFSRDSLKSLISFQIRAPIKLDIINMMSRGFPTA